MVWKGKSEYKVLASELRSLSRDAFADRVLDLLRIRWPECIGAPRGQTIDRQGVDLYTWNEGSFRLAVQCKGFEVHEARLGSAQKQQCLHSIQKFRNSKVETERYLLIHNRDSRDTDFRQGVQAAINALEAEGRVARAELWSLHELLEETFDGMTDRITSAFTASTQHDLGTFEAFDLTPVDLVPLRAGKLVIDRHRLEVEESPVEVLADPAILLLEAGSPSLTLLLGEAGYGKTTAARRAVGATERRVFFIPAARIDNEIVGAKDLLERCIDIEGLLDLEELDRKLWRRVARPVIEKLLKNPRTKTLLLFDGLDESPFFTRQRGALQHFFNLFNSVAVPVVLTSRTEFWIQRKDDLREPFGHIGAHKGGIRKHVRQLELVEWAPEQMTELARRYKEQLKNPNARAYIDHLIQTLGDGSYAKFYGDIPRRPLFLRMILDTVAEKDVQTMRRAELFQEWASLKVLRDITGPQRWGTSGRPSIADEASARDTITISFVAMEEAARLMISIQENIAVLLETCDLTTLAGRVPELAGRSDLTGLGLNSLLVPIESRLGERRHVRFAHRLFQEYFLARYLASNPDELRDVNLPADTSILLQEVRSIRHAAQVNGT